MIKPTRRTVLKTTAAGGLTLITASKAFAVAAPAAPATSPSSKLNIACIGVGGKGEVDSSEVAGENIVAICDVDEGNLAKAAKKYTKARTYTDFRKCLEQRDIDAVTVSIPDHMHAPVAMMAIERGKHVYCQKPLTHTVYEARQLAEAARAKKVATQMGTQFRSGGAHRMVIEWLWKDVIGRVTEAHSWSDRPIWPQGIDRPKDTPAVPASLHWDDWLGVAPWRAYNPAYHPFKWRGFWDFGTGALGDMGCHVMDVVFHGLKLTTPIAVSAEHSGINNETAPNWSIVTWEFPADPNGESREKLPPVKVKWYDGLKLPPQELAELGPDQKLPTNGSLFIGEKGKMLVTLESGPRLVPELRMKDFKRPDPYLPVSKGHYADWILACKGGKPALANFDYSGPQTEMVLLGNVAIRAGRPGERLEWDAKKLRFPNVPEADKYVRSEYRAEYKL